MDKKKKILVIDDDECIGSIVKLHLEQSGKYEVLISTDGQQGITAAKRRKPDLILLDILMPNMSGTDVIERLLEDKMTKDIPVIFLTGVVTKEDIKIQGGVVGGRRFLAKPVSLRDLLYTVESALLKREINLLKQEKGNLKDKLKQKKK